MIEMASRSKRIFGSTEFDLNLPAPVGSRSKSKAKSRSRSKSKSKAKSRSKSVSRSKAKNVNNKNNASFVLHREHGELEASYQERLRFVQQAKISKTKANQGRLSTLSFVKLYTKMGMEYPEEIVKQIV